MTFDIQNQCPQIYIYIFSLLASSLYAFKTAGVTGGISSIVSGVVSTVLLMGVNFCDWRFQWITWVLAALWMLSGTFTLLAFFNPSMFGVEDDEENN